MNSEQLQQWIGDFASGTGAFIGWAAGNLTQLAILSVICLFGAVILVVILRQLWKLLVSALRSLWRRLMARLRHLVGRRKVAEHQD